MSDLLKGRTFIQMDFDFLLPLRLPPSLKLRPCVAKGFAGGTRTWLKRFFLLPFTFIQIVEIRLQSHIVKNKGIDI